VAGFWMKGYGLRFSASVCCSIRPANANLGTPGEYTWAGFSVHVFLDRSEGGNHRPAVRLNSKPSKPSYDRAPLQGADVSGARVTAASLIPRFRSAGQVRRASAPDHQPRWSSCCVVGASSGCNENIWLADVSNIDAAHAVSDENRLGRARKSGGPARRGF